MENAALVGSGEPRAKLARDVESLIHGKPADPADETTEILAVDVLHGKEVQAIDLAEIVDAADVGVSHLTGEADFVAETLDGGFVVRQGFGKELEGDGLIEREIVGAIDLAHAAAAEHGDDAVAARQHISRRESAVARSSRSGGARGRVRGRRAA